MADNDRFPGAFVDSYFFGVRSVERAAIAFRSIAFR